MAFNPAIDVNAWKLIQWSGDVPKLDGQLAEFGLKISTWATSVNRALVVGSGDMLKSVYDTNKNGVVDTCDSLAWSKLTGVPATLPPTGYYGTDTTNSGSYAISVGADFTLHTGVIVFFSVSSVNSVDSPTLNVNSTGAKTICNRAGTAIYTAELVASRVHGAMYDGTVWRIFTKMVRLFNSGTNNPTVECLGYDEVRLYANYTSGASGITLAHLVEGTLVFVNISNGTGAGLAYWVMGTTLAGVNMASWYIGPGLAGAAAVRCDSSNVQSANINANVCLIGQVIGANIYFK